MIDIYLQAPDAFYDQNDKWFAIYCPRSSGKMQVYDFIVHHFHSEQLTKSLRAR